MSVVGMEVRKVVLGLMGVVITVVFEDYSWHFLVYFNYPIYQMNWKNYR